MRRGHTVFTSRDEDGRRRTRIIIQKRSYLDPGHRALPGRAQRPRLRPVAELSGASGVLDNTAFGSSQSALPDRWTLPSKNNPFVQF